MKENKLLYVLKKIYELLNGRQKVKFFIIILIMIVSAFLTQLTPKAIGWLTDDILVSNEISFVHIVPFLILILVVNILNEFIKVTRRIMV